MSDAKRMPWKWEMRLVDLVNRNTRSNNIYHRIMSETEKIEVIEYSAFTKLQSQIEEKDKQIAELVAALELIRDEMCAGKECSQMWYQDVAEEALAKVGKGNKPD